MKALSDSSYLQINGTSLAKDGTLFVYPINKDAYEDIDNTYFITNVFNGGSSQG
ncbi:hypothetical protein BDW_01450 [Bdellovibrio bacteriovorus W]|nr:hypothetical protein BDW_01450 [Bdellovibrio bacteriovorus W]